MAEWLSYHLGCLHPSQSALVPVQPHVPHSSFLGLGQTTVRRTQLNPGLPHKWQKPKHLGHSLLPSRIHISRKLELEADPRLEVKHADMECRHSKWRLSHFAKYLSHPKCVFSPLRAYFLKVILNFKGFRTWLHKNFYNQSLIPMYEFL